MNLSSNHESCSTPPFYPCLPHGESYLTHGWSRDLSWEPKAETAFQSLCFNKATNIGGRTNSFGSSWDFISNSPTDDTYNGYGLGPENLSLIGFEVRHNSEPENYEYWGGGECHLNAEVEAPDTLSHQGYGIDVDHPIDGSLQNTDTSATAINPPHCRAGSHREIICNECSEHFLHKSALDNHAKQTTHGVYACSCGVTFTRLDVLDRHIQTFNPKTFYPCTYCSKFSGLRAFTRRDHLTQHLRGYHKIENSTESITDPQLLLESTRNAKRSCLSCPHEDCLYYQEAVDNQTPLSNFQNGNMWFHSQKDCTKHMRDVHDESLYPCDVLGCDRIKGKGFCRKRDLLKHKINYHVFSDST